MITVISGLETLGSLKISAAVAFFSQHTFKSHISSLSCPVEIFHKDLTAVQKRFDLLSAV